MPPQQMWPMRTVRLVLCTAADGVLGALPAYDVDDPGWRETEAVVDRCVELYDIRPIVLRILSGPRHVPPFGGVVCYLAEVDARPRVRLEQWHGRDPLADEPRRLPYAKPGGPQRDLVWATDLIEGAGLRTTAEPVQVRTWNLSSIWRLATDGGQLWLKSTPPFCAQEGAVIARLPAGVGPDLVGFESGRVLLRDVRGEDQYDARDDALLAMIDKLVDLQVGWSSRTDELASLGVRDWRPGVFGPAATRVYELYADQLTIAERRQIETLLDGFDDGFAALAACGVPDSLVHGDFHSGNVRGRTADFRILDWGDCGVGNPLIDELAFCERRDASQVAELRAAWARLWLAAVRGSDPERAATLLRPLTSLSGAVVYQDFLDQIEPDEHRYHEDDPLASLRGAAEASARSH